MRLLWELPSRHGRPAGPGAQNRRLDTTPMQADILQRSVIERLQLRQRNPALTPGQHIPPQLPQKLAPQSFRALDRQALQQL